MKRPSRLVFSALHEIGAKSINYLGTTGSLNDRFPVGSFVTPKKAVLSDGSQIDLGQTLKPLNSISTLGGTYAHVSAPAMETQAWANQQVKNGSDYVEVELRYFLEFLRSHPNEIDGRVAMVVSDQMLGANAKDLNNWGFAQRSATTKTFMKIFRERMDVKNSGDDRVESLHFYPIDDTKSAKIQPITVSGEK
jgi:hypothetical protein